MATIKDVAKLAGVSHGTVSNVLSGKAHVSREKVERIQDAVKTLGYVPTAAARNLKSKKSMVVAVLLPFITDQHYALIYNGLERKLTDAGYFVSLYITQENPRKENEIIHMVIQQRVDAILACPSDPEQTLKTIRELNENIPVCFIERDLPPGSDNKSLNYNFIGFHHKETIIEIIQKFTAKGKSSFALICGPGEFTSERDCMDGYRTALHISEDETVPSIIITDNNKESGFRGAIELFQSSFIPEVVICTSATLAESVDKALDFTAGYLSINPEIIELGDESWSKQRNKMLTISRQSIRSGEKAAELLLKNIENPVFFETKKIFLDNKVFTRSTAPLQSGKARSTLKIATLEDKISQSLISMVRDFDYRFNCNTEIYQYPYEELYDKVTNPEEARDFDILQIDLPWMEENVNSGQLLNLDDYISRVEGFNTRNIPGTLENYALYNGSYYAIPFIFGSQLLFYRKDLFENKDIQNHYYEMYRSELRPPRNWSEFNAVARFFTKEFNMDSPTTYGTTLGGQDSSGAVCEVLPRIWGFGGNVIKDDGSIAVTEDEAMKGIENYIESFKYAPPGAPDYWWDEQVKAFSEGESAMMVLFVAHATGITNRQHSKIVGRIGYETLPGGVSLMGGWSLGIQTESSHKDLAFEFLNWVSSKEIAVPYMILGGSNPTTYLYESSELNFIYPWLSKSFESFQKSRKRNVPRGKNGTFKERQFEQILGKYIHQCIKGEISSSDAAQSIHRELEEII
ncbi:MAG: extracellular solute-binding protein [Spirochaetales bacterium]|nr:extracellular solute-binding protein [Spirochaetales bacterium]